MLNVILIYQSQCILVQILLTYIYNFKFEQLHQVILQYKQTLALKSQTEEFIDKLDKTLSDLDTYSWKWQKLRIYFIPFLLLLLIWNIAVFIINYLSMHIH